MRFSLRQQPAERDGRRWLPLLVVSLLVAALAFTLAACGDDEEADGTTTTVEGEAQPDDEANGEADENGTEPTYGAQGPGVAPGEDPETATQDDATGPVEVEFSRLMSNPESYLDTGVIVEGRVTRQVSDVAFLMGSSDEAASPGQDDLLVMLPQARGEELAEDDVIRVTGDLRRVDDAFRFSAPEVFEGAGAPALEDWQGDLAIVTTEEDNVEVVD
jgi:hypothetical protein